MMGGAAAVGLMVEHREVMNEHWLMMMTYDDI
jgi:hypothetical protein